VSAAILRAAPLPRGVPLDDKYLLDDADMIAVVNVPLIRESAFYKEHYEKLLGELLKKEPVAAILKEAGLDPFKDIERLVMMSGRSCVGDGGNHGPVVLVQGRFDAAKLYAAAARLAKDYPAGVKIEARGDTKIVEIVTVHKSFHVAVLDRGHVFLSMSGKKDLVEAALDKAAGKKKTELTIKPFVELYRKMKFDRPVEVIATSTLITGSSTMFDGMKAETKVFTLADDGVEWLRATADVKDDVKLQVTLATKDAAKAADMAKTMGEELKRAAAQMPREYAAMGKAMAATRFESKDKNVLIEGAADAEAIRQMVSGSIFGISGEPARPAKDATPKPLGTKSALPK
jgi:hypothetical protein